MNIRIGIGAMFSWSKTLTLFALAGCSFGTVPLDARIRLSVVTKKPPSVKYRRVRAVTMVVADYAPWKDKVSSVDLGLREELKDEKLHCSILSPQNHTKAAKATWFPMDFYTNVLNEDEQNEEAQNLGEPNVFWPGDDNNRNGSTDAHFWTIFPQKAFSGSLDFLHRSPEQWVDTSVRAISYVVQFTRGKLRYKNIFGFQTWPNQAKTQCLAGAFLCSATVQDKNGVDRCAPNGWKYRLYKVIAGADAKGFFYDQLPGGPTNEKEKNDVAYLDALVADIEPDTGAIGDRYTLKLAAK